MVQEHAHARWGGQGIDDAGTNRHTPIGPATPTTPQHGAPLPVDAEELAAGCALSDGFRLLHQQRTGLPTTLRALLGGARQNKVSALVLPTAAARVATVTRKLTLIPLLLAEWQTSPPLPTAQILCSQARHLFADVPFTRQFLRAQSRGFHDAVVAGTTALPAALCHATQRAIGAAEEQIRLSCHRLVERHLYMVQLIAHEYQAFGISADDLADLTQDGCLGLLAAAELFDVRAGARFHTYATYWLRQAVTRSLRARRIVMPPRAQQRVARQLTRTARQLEQLFTRAISPDELAAATGVPPRDIAAAFATQRREVSLDVPRGDGRTWAEVLAAPDYPPGEDDPPSEAESTHPVRLRRGHGC